MQKYLKRVVANNDVQSKLRKYRLLGLELKRILVHQ